jgi:hypothetical protein
LERHPLASAFDKLDGAKEQVRFLESVSKKGAVTDLLKTRTDRDRQGRVRVRVEEIGDVPPEWLIRIGECIYDIRSALDHLAYALNVVGSGAPSPPNWESSQFPLYTSRRGFRRMCQRALKRPENSPIGYLPRGARTAIERLQPYHRRHDDDAWRLGELVALSNIDKHRRVPITTVTNSTMRWSHRVQGHAVTDAKVPYRRLKPGATMIWLTVPTLPLNVKEPQVHFGHGADIEFEGKAGNPPVPLVLPHEPVWFVLEMILYTIRTRVIPDLARFFS